MHRIRKQFKFEAAHMLQDAFTDGCWKCIHGHSYVVELFVIAKRLNKDDMVVDFGELKKFQEQVFGDWDHALLLHEDQRENFIVLEQNSVLQKIVYIPCSPTAEAMAEYIYDKFVLFMEDRFKSSMVGFVPIDASNEPRAEKVRIHETLNGWAEFGEDRI